MRGAYIIKEALIKVAEVSEKKLWIFWLVWINLNNIKKPFASVYAK